MFLGWSGLWGPPDLPPEVVSKWAGILAALKEDPDWIDATEKLGSFPHILPPGETAEFVKKQHDVFEDVAERLGLTIR